MQISSKPTPDPVAGHYVLTDAAVRWAFSAAEDVVGRQGLAVVLRNAGLARFIDNYPGEDFKINKVISNGEYARFNAELITFFGRAGKSMLIRIGRLWAKQAVEKQSAAMGLAALIASKILPAPTQIKMLMDAMQGTFRRQAQEAGQLFIGSSEDRGDKIAYIAGNCPLCAGKQADAHICWSWNGTLQEALLWQTGKSFRVEEVACRAAGAEACVWEVEKTPEG